VDERVIVAMGGGAETEERTRALIVHALSLSGRERPQVCYVPTAIGDDPAGIVRFHELLRGRATVEHIPFFPWPPPDLRERVLGSDVVFIGGGNTANMLAIWRVHGFDGLLREAWEAGIVLCGWSAGMICWFEAGVTDSFGPQLEGLRDGLAFLSGSACPHYDGEERRRPVYQRLVAEGFPAGVAADDGVGLVYRGTGLDEAVSVRPGATAYRVGPDGEEPVPARALA
jgi:dipeptidase E